MDYRLTTSPDDVAIHQVVGSRFIGTNANPLLSIKCMFGGIGDYTTDNGQRHKIDDSSYLVLNHDHGYTIEKIARHPVETFCTFFPVSLTSSIAREFAKSDDHLLNLSTSSSSEVFNFFEHRRPHGGQVTQQIRQLRKIIASNDLNDAAVETTMIAMLCCLLREHREIRKRISRFKWARSTTRTELYRRIQVARDFMHASLAEPFSISQTAQIAMLSKYHFLRSFRHITGETPLSYLQRIRVEQAIQLISNTSLSITDISNAVGYESLPSFSSLFRSHTKLSPSEFRKQHCK